jgi:hypothetical protein
MKTKSTLNPNILTALENQYGLPAFQISDHPQMVGLARVIQITDFNIQGEVNQLYFYSKIFHYKDGVKLNDFTKKITDWYIGKDDITAVLGADFQPVANPNFNSSLAQSPSNLPYQTTNAYKLFTNIVLHSNIDRKIVLGAYVERNDQTGDYDK